MQCFLIGKLESAYVSSKLRDEFGSITACCAQRGSLRALAAACLPRQYHNGGVPRRFPTHHRRRTSFCHEATPSLGSPPNARYAVTVLHRKGASGAPRNPGSGVPGTPRDSRGPTLATTPDHYQQQQQQQQQQQVTSLSPSHRNRAAVHYAVVGAGLAGVATVWQLLSRSPRGQPVVVDLYDAAGIAAGGSGAAAGLLHPYSPRGKLLWRGEEAMAAALELVAAAETAAAAGPAGGVWPAAATASGVSGAAAAVAAPDRGPHCGPPTSPARGTGDDALAGRPHPGGGPFVWRSGLVRVAASPKQAVDFARAAAAAAATATATATSMSAAVAPSAAAGAVPRVDGTSRTSREAEAEAEADRRSLQTLTAAELQALVPGLVLPAARTAASQPAAPAAAAPEADSSSGEGGDVPATGRGALSGAGGRGANRRARRAAKGAATAAAAAAALDPAAAEGQVAGLIIPQGLVLDVAAYLRALWRACEVQAEARDDGSCARLRLQRVTSLERMSWAWERERAQEGGAGERPAPEAAAQQQQQQPPDGLYDAIVVAAGAAAATVEEVERARLPLQLCQGLTLVMQPDCGALGSAAVSGAAHAPLPPGPPPPPPSASAPPGARSYPAGSPSLLGQPYMAAQGPTRLVVGATKSYGWTPQAALEACGRSEYAEQQQQQQQLKRCGSEPTAVFNPNAEGVDVPDVAQSGGLQPASAEAISEAGVQMRSVAADPQAQAVAELRASACGVWAPLAGWRVAAVREGVRALPPRTTHGSVPLLGRLAPDRPWWLVGGLGSRGLVYHGWLARLAADAVLNDSEQGIPGELTMWRAVAADSAVFEAP